MFVQKLQMGCLMTSATLQLIVLTIACVLRLDSSGEKNVLNVSK